MSKQFLVGEKARKHFNVATVNEVVGQNRNGQEHPTNKVQVPVHNVTEGPQVFKNPHLLADNGILGISDVEDSAKWAASEIKKIPVKPDSKAKQSEELQSKEDTENGKTATNTSRIFSPQITAHISQPAEKIGDVHTIGANVKKLKAQQPPNENTASGINTTKAMLQSSRLSQGEEAKDPENINLTDSLQSSSMITAGTKVGSQIRNATIRTPWANMIGQSYATNDPTTLQPFLADVYSIKAPNGTKFRVTVAQTNSQATHDNVPDNNATASLVKTTKDTTSTPARPLLPNPTTSNKLFPYKSIAANNKDKDENAPSLSVNFTSLRQGQSFDMQMPTSMSSNGTYQDNRFHLAPHATLSSEYLSDGLQNDSSNFLNETLDKVNVEEQGNGKLLQKLNSDIAAAKGDPLVSNINSVSKVTDEDFREETPAGRTFADKVLEASSNQDLLNRKGQQTQQVQQDEGLARALNQSSVSSIIFSANEAISNSDMQVFSKKSAQGRVHVKGKEHRSKRGSYFHRLPEHRRKSKKLHKKATPRQVINLGNHFLWFGDQGAVDANGFPRQNTATENPQYSVNSYVSNFLNSANEKEEGASATKGYQALQNALSSMESNQEEEEGDSSFHYGISGNKDTNQGQTPTSVVIQDNAGKPVYQGVVNIVKLNNTKSNDSVSSEVEPQNHDDRKDEASNKNSSQAEPDSLKNMNINNQSAIPKTNSTLLTSLQDDVEKVNQKETPDLAGLANDSSSTVSKEIDANQKQTQEIKDVNQSKQKQILTEQMQSEYQDPQKPSSEAKPSAIIKQLTTNSNEPETYHLVVNDAGKKITNANGHVTVIISGPTASQASMPSKNTLLIPQTKTPTSPSENADISYKERHLSTLSDDQSFLTQSDQLSHSLSSGTRGNTSQSSLNDSRTNGSLALLQEDALSALKISEGIEGQLNKGQSQMGMANQSQEASTSETKQYKTANAQSTESLMQEGHHFVNVGQDLTSGVDGLQMEEVSRPKIQEEQKQENENLLMEPPGGRYMEALEKSLAEQSQDVPTLNIVLDPAQKIGGSLSVGGKVVPVASSQAEGGSTQFSAGHKQQLDCHADPKNGKTTVTILTCQKKQSLPNMPQSLNKQDEAYYGKGQMTGGPALQLDQVMTVLNDQVKATINKEMKSESKDIQKMLTGMNAPSTTLMDADEASSQSPQRSSLVGPEESYTSLPEDEEHDRWESHRPHHRRMHHFGFPHHLGFPNYLGFLNHALPPHRRHFWGFRRPSNPFVVMAHKDHSGEGYWDYQHNIFIPREDDDDDDEEEDNRGKHWTPYAQQGFKKGTWFMPHSTFHQPHFSPFAHRDLFHLRLPTIFGRSGPWKPLSFHKQEKGTKRTAVVHKTVRGDRDTCRPIIEGPSPPLKGEWEYLGKVLCSCPCKLSDAEW